MKRLITILLSISLFVPSCWMNMQAQDRSVSLNVDGVALSKVLSMIEKQTGFIFLYKDSSVNLDRSVTVRLTNKPIEFVLKSILDKEIGYKIIGRQISLFHIDEKPQINDSKETFPKTTAPVTPPIHLVKGRVRDKTGSGVIGAAVIETGASNHAITDLDGNFVIILSKPDAVIEISCIGFINRVIKCSGGEILDIVLEDDVKMLDEVVVVGYGVQRKESVVGAIAQIQTEDIVNTGLTNVTQAIAGKLSGVLTMQTSGAPGANNAEIIIRGVSSWNGSSPLVMVDGVERNFSTIDPNEIENISVLKDASATAVFGAKGANGVILVTTRGGKEGKPVMKMNISQGFNFATRLPAHISAYDTALGWNVAMMNSMNYANMYSEADLAEFANPSSAINALRYPDINWFDELLKDVANTTDANLNISGGTRRARYFISLGYKNEGSIFEDSELYGFGNYGYDRFNYRANLDFNVTSSTILSFKVGGDIASRLSPGTDPMRSLYGAATISYPINYPAWLLEQVPDPSAETASGIRLVDSARSGSYFLNPYNSLNNASFRKYATSNLYTDLLLKQDLDFITEGLSINGKFSFSTSMTRLAESLSASPIKYYFDWSIYDSGTGNPWLPESYSTNAVVEDPPYLPQQGNLSSNSYTMYWDASLAYDRTFNNHHVTALGLFNQREYRYGIEFPYRNQGVVGRVTYDYARKYLFEGNIGITGSEQFAPSNRYGVFPSLALGYMISEESFWKRAMPWWSKFKIRYSDGLVGNDKTSSRWLYYSAYSVSDSYKKFITGMTPVITEDSTGNESAQWEEAHKRDIGIESAWFKNRLSMTFDLFDEYRSKMLVSRSNNTTAIVGTTFKEANLGSMKKHGLELELGWKDKIGNNFSYNLSAMLSLSENRIINYEDAINAPDYQKMAGKAFAGQTSGETLVDEGYYVDVDDIHNYPSYTAGSWLTDVVPGSYKYLDYCVDGIINQSDLHAIDGSFYPASVFSFGGGFRWKGWEFSFLFYGNGGKYVEFNSNFVLEFEKGDRRMSTANSDYWTPTNRNAKHATLVDNGIGVHAHQMYGWAGGIGTEGTALKLPEHTWRNADYLTLRDLYLAYTFKSKQMKSRLGIDSIILYTTCNNLLHFTDLIEGNPEATTFRDGFYPLMKTVQIGLKAGF